MASCILQLPKPIMCEDGRIVEKALFLHISKTGGVSIMNAMQVLGATRYPVVGLKDRVSAAARVDELINGAWEEYFSFAVVRNPWDWQVSGWKYCVERGCWSDPPTFTEFLMDEWEVDLSLRSPLPQKFTTSKICVEQHALITQWEHLTLASGNVVPADFFARMETLVDDWATVCDTLELPCIPLPHLNQSSHRPYQSYYTESSRLLVSDRNKDLIARFGYTFEQ